MASHPSLAVWLDVTHSKPKPRGFLFIVSPQHTYDQSIESRNKPSVLEGSAMSLHRRYFTIYIHNTIHEPAHVSVFDFLYTVTWMSV